MKGCAGLVLSFSKGKNLRKHGYFDIGKHRTTQNDDETVKVIQIIKLTFLNSP